MKIAFGFWRRRVRSYLPPRPDMATTDQGRTPDRSAAILMVAALALASCGTPEEPTSRLPERPTAGQRGEDTPQPEILRSAGESATQFAKRVIPGGTDLAFEPVEISCGPPGSSLVFLFRNADSLSNYTGWVLHPVGTDSTKYRKAVLPTMDEAPGLFDITVKSVFAAEAGHTPGPELIVLYQYYRTGSGADPEYATYVYTWTGRSFEVDSETSSSLVGLENESDVRSKLATMGR